uniref:Uncharacterized protein n=1 Tax=Heterorhabditis bacteriophora TaxID=37862 RepID=A0A1I7WKT5_HETBA
MILYRIGSLTAAPTVHPLPYTVQMRLNVVFGITFDLLYRTEKS